MTDWHGWGDGRAALHVGYLPGRKSPALYLQDGGLVRPLAYFKSEAAAAQAMDVLDGFILGRRVDAQ